MICSLLFQVSTFHRTQKCTETRRVLRYFDFGILRRARLFDHFEAEGFDDGVGEDVGGDAAGLLLGLGVRCAVKIEDEEFTLAHGFHRW